MHAIATHLLNLGKIDEAMTWLARADKIKPTILVKRHLAQLFARFAADKCQEMLAQCAFLQRDDRMYVEKFLETMNPWKFINIPVPHEGEQEVSG